VKETRLERCEEKETCYITCRPWQHNPAVRPNTVLLRICGLNLHHTIKIKYQSQKETKYTPSPKYKIKGMSGLRILEEEED